MPGWWQCWYQGGFQNGSCLSGVQQGGSLSKTCPLGTGPFTTKIRKRMAALRVFAGTDGTGGGRPGHLRQVAGRGQLALSTLWVWSSHGISQKGGNPACTHWGFIMFTLHQCWW